MDETLQDEKLGLQKTRRAQGTRSSGNVFADLDVPNPEVEQAKVQIAAEINAALAQKGASQAKRALVLGVAQPVISNLERFELAGFSIERLMRYATHLGVSVEVKVKPSAKR